VESAIPALAAVNGHAHSESLNSSSSASSEGKSFQPKPRSKGRGGLFLAGGMLAASAAGLAALLTSGPDEPQSPRVANQTDKVVGLIQRAFDLNHEAISIQASQTEALQSELRILKQMAKHSDAMPEEVDFIERKIRTLTERVDRLTVLTP